LQCFFKLAVYFKASISVSFFTLLKKRLFHEKYLLKNKLAYQIESHMSAKSKDPCVAKNAMLIKRRTGTLAPALKYL
jgi:hypothetical protein